MSDSVKIYCVNDGDANALIDVNVFGEEDYDIKFLASGQTCIDVSQEDVPDLILLDTSTPDLDGFETCSKIRQSSRLNHIPIIFISSDASIDSRLHSYGVGGDDYVIKPFEVSELKAKSKAAIKRNSTLDKAKKEVSDVTLSTMDIMKSMGEMSAVVHFLQGTCSCDSYDSLAKKVIKAHESLGLDVALQILVKGEKMHFFTGGVENPLEDSVFEFMRSKGRLVDFGQRTAVNYPYVSIIVRNMPSDNPDLHGRIRDHIAIIGQGADSKVKGLQAEIAVKAQRESLLNIIGQIESTVANIGQGYKEQQKASEMILSYVGESLEESFLSLALSNKQEEYLRGFIGDFEDKINAIFSPGLNLEKEFSVILDHINVALNDTVVDSKDETVEEEEIDDETVTLF